MIATVTLNPAVDKTLKASRVILGTVNRTDDVINMAGGKGINVAKVLKQYGTDVKTLGFLGGYTGDLIENDMKQKGIASAFTKVKEETRTSINVLSEDGYITEFLEPGPNITEDELKRFIENYANEIKDCKIVVLSGSAPRGIPDTIYADLIDIANKEGKKVLLDSSGDLLKKGMYARPFMIKPNLKELEALMGKRIQGMQEVCEAASWIIEWGVPNVVVSMGNKGILYARKGTDNIELYYVQAPSIRVINTIGSGDSAVAAFALSMIKGLSPEDTVKTCVAVSAANAMSLENGVIDIDEAKRMFDKLTLCNPVY